MAVPLRPSRLRLTSTFRSALGTLGFSKREASAVPGAAPGVDSALAPAHPTHQSVTAIDVSEERIDRLRESATLDGLPKPADWRRYRWIDVVGATPAILKACMSEYGVHTLTAEDILNLSQRPRIEVFDDYVFVVARMLYVKAGVIEAEQVSLLLFSNRLITFQERPGDVFGEVRRRLNTPGSKLRRNGPSFLAYALVDALIDHLFPILEAYGDELAELEPEILSHPSRSLQGRIQTIRRDMMTIKRVIWPMRDMVDSFLKSDSALVSSTTETYLRDVQAHAVQLVDHIEYYRETAGTLNDLYLSVLSHRTNQAMKVMSLIATIFIPLNFLAAVYGMNFEYFPELKWPYAYFAFWGVCGVVIIGLLTLFSRMGWLRRDE